MFLPLTEAVHLSQKLARATLSAYGIHLVLKVVKSDFVSLFTTAFDASISNISLYVL